jgi:hypothetical protein
MGREAPKELREPRLSFMDGARDRLCMKCETSAVAERVAGTSTELAVPSSTASPGIASVLLSRDLVGARGAPTPAASSESEIPDILEVDEMEDRWGIKMGCEVMDFLEAEDEMLNERDG